MKRTPDQLRRHIQLRLAQGNASIAGGRRRPTLSPSAPMMNATDLGRASKKISAIPDEGDRRMLLNLFSTFSKYQALGMLLAPGGRWMKHYPELAIEIADEATALDDGEMIPIRTS